jgi:hypothetical protein
MTKLISGRVPKIPSANVRADRYEFLEISEAEPDLGLPSQLGQVFTSDLSGNRYWTRLDTANVSETTNLYFTADRAINALTGNNVTVNNLTVSGDLAVLGNLVSINTTTLNVEDRNILIANGAINSAQADNAGITIAGANAEIKYQNTGDKFDINKNVNIQGNLSIGGSIQAKDANSLLRNEINLDPNNGTYMSVRSEEINTFFNSSSWDTASWIDDGGGVAVITNATTLYTFWDTGVGSVVNNIEVSINGGSRIPVQFNSGNAVSGNVSLDLANGQPSGVPPTNPTAITSLNFFYRTKSSINIDYSGSEILLDAQSMDIDLRTTENLDLRSGQNLNIRSLGSYPVRIYTDDTTRMWEFDNTGSLTLPKEGKIYGIGQGSASDRYGYISWDGNSSGDGSGYNTMRLVPDQLGLEEADQYIIIDPTGGQPGHIHIRAGGTQDNSSANLFLGGENSYVMLAAGTNPPVTIAANNNSWIFSTDGDLRLPGGGTIDEATGIKLTPAGGANAGQALVIYPTAGPPEGNHIHLAAYGANTELYLGTDTHYVKLVDGGDVQIQAATANLSATAAWTFGTDGSITSTEVLTLKVPNGIPSGITGLSSAGGWNTSPYSNLATTGGTGTGLRVNASSPGSGYLDTVTIHTPGSGYTNGDVITITNENSLTATFNVLISGTNSWIFGIDGTTSLPNDINVQGDVTINGEFVGKGLTSNTIVANVITSNEWYGIYTANVVESSSSLYFTNARVISAVTPLLTTANVLELDNFYFTNVRTILAVSPLLTTANVTELNNLYYTNSRVIAAVTPLLTTSNVIEGTNLYYTDARVLANVEQMSVNVFADVDITGILNNGILVWNGTKFVAGTVDAGATSNLALFAEVANTVLTLSNFTTANLAEGTNLYFTNARSVGSLTAGQNITIEANGRISADVTSTLANITTVIDNLTTDSIAEGAINLYYTNSRVRSTLSGGTGVIYDSSAGSISIGQNVSTESSVVFKNLTLNGNLYVLGNLFSVFANTLTVSDPIIQIGYGNPSDSYDLGFVGHYNDGVERHTGLFRDHNDGKFKLFDNLTPEPGLINVDTSNVSFRYASLVVSTLEGNVTGTVGTLSNFTTANLKESTSNLYYTNDRVVTAVIPLLTTSNVIEGTNLYYTAERVNATVQPFLTTANVIETSGNLYFTAARVNATVQPFLTTANVTETSGNLYFTNARVVSALIAGQNITIEANGRISANSTTASSLNLTTADVREVSSNLYYTDARVVTAVTPLLTTANVIEGTNQYFTNARSRSAFTPGKGIAITASGIITNTGASFEYNTGIDGSGYGNVLSTMSPIVIFPSTPTTDRFVLRSLHITNISDTDVSVSGNVLYATGNTAVIANRLPLPSGSSFELLEIPQVFQPNDIVNLQGFNTAGTATSNLLQAIYSYETFTGDITYKGQGITLATSNTDILVFESTLAFSIIESIKFVNLTSSVVPVKLYWADANNVIKAHFAHNLSLPSNSTLETIIKPKRISQGDRIFASYRNADSNSVSVFLSARTGYEYTPVSYSPNVIPSGTVSASFSSSESDGTLIYYTIE